MYILEFSEQSKILIDYPPVMLYSDFDFWTRFGWKISITTTRSLKTQPQSWPTGLNNSSKF